MKIRRSTRSSKKLMAVFRDGTVTHFGQRGAEDYTITKDVDQRRRYLARHRRNENWSDYKSAGALARHILWGPSTSVEANTKAFKKKFRL